MPERTLPFMRTLRRTTWPTRPYNKVMINIVFPASRRRLWGYWWAPVAILALVLAVVAYLRPYQDLQLSDLQPGWRQEPTNSPTTYAEMLETLC